MEAGDQCLALDRGSLSLPAGTGFGEALEYFHGEKGP